MSNHDRSNHDRRIMSENPGVYIAMKSAVMVKVDLYGYPALTSILQGLNEHADVTEHLRSS